MLIVGCMNPASGYGRIGTSISRYLVSKGHTVRIIPKFPSSLYPEDLQAYITSQRMSKQVLADLAIAPLSAIESLSARSLITMWESSALPPDRIPLLNRFGTIYLPCSANMDWFRNAGVTSRLVKFQLGADGTVTPLKFDPFVFGVIAADNNVPERKKIGNIVQAFEEEFGPDDNVRLQVKMTPSCSPLQSANPNVTIYRENWLQPRLDQFIADTTVGVFCTAMEGWGLPANELLASGRPVIAPYWGGYADFLSNDTGWSLNYTLIPAPIAVFKGIGEVPEVSIAELKAKMRYVVSHQEEVKAKAVTAALVGKTYSIQGMQEAFYSGFTEVENLRFLAVLQTFGNRPT